MKLKRYLRLNDLTSTEMALELGISHATMSRYLRGVSLPPIRIARIICKKTTAMVSQNDLVDQYLEFNLGSKKTRVPEHGKTNPCYKKADEFLKNFKKVMKA